MPKNKFIKIGLALVAAIALTYGGWRLFTGLGGLVEVEPKDPFVEFSCAEKTFQECNEFYHKQFEGIVDKALMRMKEIKEDGKPKKGKYFDHIKEPTCRKYVKEESANPSCTALFLTDLYHLYLREVHRCYLSDDLILEDYKCPKPGEFSEYKRGEDQPNEFLPLMQASSTFQDQIVIETNLASVELEITLMLFDEHYRDFSFHVDQLRIIDAAKKYRKQIKDTTPYAQKLPCKYNLATSRTCKL